MAYTHAEAFIQGSDILQNTKIQSNSVIRLLHIYDSIILSVYRMTQTLLLTYTKYRIIQYALNTFLAIQNQLAIKKINNLTNSLDNSGQKLMLWWIWTWLTLVQLFLMKRIQSSFSKIVFQKGSQIVQQQYKIEF